MLIYGKLSIVRAEDMSDYLTSLLDYFTVVRFEVKAPTWILITAALDSGFNSVSLTLFVYMCLHLKRKRDYRYLYPIQESVDWYKKLIKYLVLLFSLFLFFSVFKLCLPCEDSTGSQRNASLFLDYKRHEIFI